MELILIRSALNSGCPGLGSVVDFYEAVTDVCDGNFISAAVNVCSGVYDIFTLGFYGTARQIARRTAKKASVDMAKQFCKVSTKTLGKEAAKDIAKGTPKKLAVECAKLSADRVKKEIGAKLAKELASGLLNEATEKAFQQTTVQVALKTAGLSVLGSGGKSLKIALLEAMIEGIKNEFLGATSSKSFNSSFRSTATTAAKSDATSYYKDELMRDLAFNSGKAILNRHQKENEK